MNEGGTAAETLMTEAGRIIRGKKSVNVISSAINLTCIEQGLNLDLRSIPPTYATRYHNPVPSKYGFLLQCKTQIQSSYLSSFTYSFTIPVLTI
jgi:hypothetical protein